MKNRHIALLVLFLVNRASAAVTIATANWHTFDLIGEVLKMEFKTRGVDTENSAKRYGSSKRAVEGLLAGETQVVPEAWVNIRKANGFYALPGFTCGDVSLCNVPTSCTRPTSPNCTACEQACSADMQCRMYSCSAIEVNDTLRCQLWRAPHLPTVVAETTTECTLKAGLIDLQDVSTGLEGIYVPNSVGATDWTTPEALSSTPLEVLIGSPVSWATSHAATVAIASKYNLQLITPPSAESLLKQIFQYMKRKAKFAFYYWKPHAVTAAYEVTKVTIPLNTAVSPPAAYFPFTRLQTVWRVDSADAVKYVPKIPSTRNLTEDQFRDMLDVVAGKISLTLPPTDAAYQKAIVTAARAHLCAVTQRLEFCIPVDRWSMEKGPDLPERALVWTRHCIGFVKCISDDGEPLLRPEKGYSIDHLHLVMQMVGYKRQEYDVRCYHEADSFAGMIAKTGQERASLTHSCITITSERLLKASFSTAFYHTGLDILIKRPDETEQDHAKQLWASLSPFDMDAWRMFASVFIITTVLLLLAECRHHVRAPPAVPGVSGSPSVQNEEVSLSRISVSSTSSSRRRSSVEVVIMIMGALEETMTTVQKEHWTSLKSWVSQFFMVFNTMLVIIIVEFYTANLAAMLVVNTAGAKMVRGVADLRGKTVATVRATATSDWLVEHEPEMNLLLCDVEQECVDFVLGGSADAFVYDDPILEYIAGENCNVMVVNGPFFFSKDFGIVLPPGSPLLGPISHAVTLLREEGVHMKLQAKYFPVKECKREQATSKIEALTIVGLLTLVLVMFVIAAVISSCLLRADRILADNLSPNPKAESTKDIADKLRQLGIGDDQAAGGSESSSSESLAKESDKAPETMTNFNVQNAQSEQSLGTVASVLPNETKRLEGSPRDKTAVEVAAMSSADSVGRTDGIPSMPTEIPGLSSSPAKASQQPEDETSELGTVVVRVADIVAAPAVKGGAP